jgi:predicted HD phosphohydrolase
MTQDPAAETADFEAPAYGQEACQVRRWDDDAKDPDAPAKSFAQLEDLLRGLAR